MLLHLCVRGVNQCDIVRRCVREGSRAARLREVEDGGARICERARVGFIHGRWRLAREPQTEPVEGFLDCGEEK